MILIISKDSFEDSTEHVMDWLESFSIPCIRLNGEDIDESSLLDLSLTENGIDLKIESEDLTLKVSDIHAVWYRRWSHRKAYESIEFCVNNNHQSNSDKINFKLIKHLDSELRKLSALVFSLFQESIWLSHPRNSSPNKIEVLLKAIQVGFAVPDTIITTSKTRLESFISKHKRIITKSVSESPLLIWKDKFYVAYTSEMTSPVIHSLKDWFFPSLFQKQLEKEFELRVFYLEGKSYAMAIFSQSDSNTRTDFREYNHGKPNRCVPYKLPEEIANKINSLMDILELETGSIDLIKTKNGKYVFLEVNPIGQFGMVSYPCNYFLERKIAECLIKKQKI